MTLVPSDATLDKITGAPAADLTPDDDVEKGEGTFPQRARVEAPPAFLQPRKAGRGHDLGIRAGALRRRDPTGEIYAYRDRHTVLSVSLRSQGSLKDVFIASRPGVASSTGAGIAAFQRAQPLPNPPHRSCSNPGRNEIQLQLRVLPRGLQPAGGAHPPQRLY